MYDFSNIGYCQPIVEMLGQYFMQKNNLNSNPGTLQALLSDINTRSRRFEISRPNGKDPLYFMEWQTQEDCYTGQQYVSATGCTYDVCAPGTETNNKAGVFIDRSMLQCLASDPGRGAPLEPFPQLSLEYDYSDGSLHRTVCDHNEAEFVGRRIGEYMWRYALALNNYLYGRLSGNYAQYTSTTGDSDCVPHDNPGCGKGGWFNLAGQLQTGVIQFNALNEAGAIFPYFRGDLRKFYMVNGMEQNPIIVHGLGAIFDYAYHVAQGAFCCNDAGVNTAALANAIDGSYFMESRPRANNNAGVTQDSVLMWEPGNHQLIFDLDFIGPTANVVQYDYERRIIVDPRTGIPFYFVRRLTKCDKHDKNTYNIIPPHFFCMSKPPTMDQCPDGSNQTFCMEIQKCTPTDCAGQPAWGALGDPTADLDGVQSPD